MRRVAGHVQRLVAGYRELGFRPAHEDIPMVMPPTQNVAEEITQIEQAIGPLPAALKASMAIVGDVYLAGDCPELGLTYNDYVSVSTMPPGPDWPDPLALPGVDQLRTEWGYWAEDLESRDGPFAFPLAPDELHKANVSGGTHDIQLPDEHADPLLHGVAGRDGITLVDYLRISVAWGGLPGYSFEPGAAPLAVAALRVRPDF